MSAQLLRDTRTLAILAHETRDPEREVALAGAALLMGACAVEATLHEATFQCKPELYTRKYCRMPAVQKFAKIRGTKSRDLQRLMSLRNALAHGEPDNERGRDLSKYFNASAATEILEKVECLCREIWQDRMPKWYSDVAFPRAD